MWSRRRLLGTGATAAATVVAGCVGTGAPSGGDAEVTTVDTLDVGGSPGDEVAVVPPGEVVLLDFFATWCAPCKPQMDHLRTIDEEFPDVHMLSITNESDADAVASFWEEYEGTWPVALDPEVTVTARHDATRVPTKIVYDADGEEQWRHVGLSAAESIAEQLRAAGATG